MATDLGVRESKVRRFAGERPRASQGRETRTIVGTVDLRRRVVRVRKLREERFRKSQGNDLGFTEV
jgi:hypothetical protein